MLNIYMLNIKKFAHTHPSSLAEHLQVQFWDSSYILIHTVKQGFIYQRQESSKLLFWQQHKNGLKNWNKYMSTIQQSELKGEKKKRKNDKFKETNI